MKKILLLFLPVAAAAQVQPKPYELKLNLSFQKPIDQVYLRYRSGEEMVMDSAQVKEGALAFKGRLAEPVLASINVKFVKGADEAQAARQSFSFFLEPGKVELLAKDTLSQATVKGSQSQKDFQKLNEWLKPLNEQLQAAYTAYSEARKSGDAAALKAAEQKIESADAELKKNGYRAFIEKYPASPVAVYALRNYAGWQLKPEELEPLFARMPANLRQTPSALQFAEEIETAKKTGIGRMAMDFTQNDTLGKPVALASFRGKYLLIDFWASWCGPCRKENPNLVKAFNKYKDRNFTILGVSLDREGQHDRWMKAIHDDGLTWTHVSDLKFWDNAAAKQYGIRAIPQNLLLDPSGKIIAKNLNGEALEKKLEEVLGAAVAGR